MYFDAAATTLISEEALKTYEMVAKEFYGNPSSIHSDGIKAKNKLEEERKKISSILKVEPANIVFTSGATESIHLFLTSLLWHDKGEIITTKIEHEAVSSIYPLLTQYGWKITYLKTKNGNINLEELREKLNSNVKLVSIMSVNNVTGAILPISDISAVIREYEKSINHKILFFSDAVQALGKTNLDLKKMDVDAASFSSHKINGPRGLGLLYLKNPNSFRPISAAGGQENGKRGGTENLAAIASFSKALEEWYLDKEREERAKEIKDYLIQGLKEVGFIINSPINSSPFILNVSSSLPSEVYTRILRDKGFSVSSGSACSNNSKGKTDNILISMGVKPEDASKAIRLSFDRSTTKKDAEKLLNVIREENGKL